MSVAQTYMSKGCGWLRFAWSLALAFFLYKTYKNFYVRQSLTSLIVLKKLRKQYYEELPIAYLGDIAICLNLHELHTCTLHFLFTTHFLIVTIKPFCVITRTTVTRPCQRRPKLRFAYILSGHGLKLTWDIIVLFIYNYCLSNFNIFSFGHQPHDHNKIVRSSKMTVPNQLPFCKSCISPRTYLHLFFLSLIFTLEHISKGILAVQLLGFSL